MRCIKPQADLQGGIRHHHNHIEACGRFSYAELADSIHEVLSLFTVKSDKREYSANQLLKHLQRTPGYRTLSLETMDQVCSLGISL